MDIVIQKLTDLSMYVLGRKEFWTVELCSNGDDGLLFVSRCEVCCKLYACMCLCSLRFELATLRGNVEGLEGPEAMLLPHKQKDRTKGGADATSVTY
jgi:hypothetical protein